MGHGAAADDIIRRLRAVDPARPRLDRAVVERGLMEHLDLLGQRRRPVVWCPGIAAMIERLSRLFPALASVPSYREVGTNSLWDFVIDPAWQTAVVATSHVERGCSREFAWDSAGMDARSAANSAAWRAWRASLRVVSEFPFAVSKNMGEGVAWQVSWPDVQDPPWNAAFYAASSAFYSSSSLLPFVGCFEAGLDRFCMTPVEIIATPQPVLHIVAGRLHAPEGPAVVYPDGVRLWFWNGVQVPQWVVERPGEITLAAIDAERNAEVKRVMVERFGWDRFAAACNAVCLDHDERWGSLMVRYVPNLVASDPLVFLVVTNRSAEPDGSFRRYVLPVHPHCRPLPDPDSGDTWLGPAQPLTALNAVASTFGMTGARYAALQAES